jgi:hypothetical protein
VSSGNGGGGGVVNTLIYKALGVVGLAILVGMLLVPTMGAPRTASLYGTTAIVGGTSTGITLATLPEYFRSVGTGWTLVKGDKTITDGFIPPTKAECKDDPKLKGCS